MYANKTRSHMMTLKDKLAIPRGSKSVVGYLQDLKIVVDELALINSPIDEDDLVIYALNGVGANCYSS
ncbi:hypothetical protein PTKIN_Ptkin08bG0080600 [Pterospermum kingtungense]